MKSSVQSTHSFRRASRQIARKLLGNPRDLIPPDSSVVLSHNGIALPPASLRDLVRKGATSAELFVEEGADVYEKMVGFLRNCNLDFGDFNRVLEFGVGCSRVARHLLASHCIDFVGIDVDSTLVDWNKRNISSSEVIRGHAEFAVNSYLPPVNLQSESFDFIYSISVFTHLLPDDQISWFRELERVLAPNGYLLVSIIEEEPGKLPGGVISVKRRDRDTVRSWLGQVGAPNNYLTTRNTAKYCSDVLPEVSYLIHFESKIIRGKQSLLLFRKFGERN